MNQRVSVLAACFQQKNLILTAGREPVCQNATCGACTNDNKVYGFFHDLSLIVCELNSSLIGNFYVFLNAKKGCVASLVDC
jgi:hypothetical protein